MQKIVVFLFLISVSLTSKSQWYDFNKVNAKAAKLYNNAVDKAQNGDYENAIILIKDAIKVDARFVDAYLSLAGIDAEMKNYVSSISNYKIAIDLDSVYSNYYLLPYSISLAGNGQFEDALDAVNQFLKNPTLNDRSRKAGLFRKNTYEFAVAKKEQLKKISYTFSPINLGDSINSSAPEYFPSLTIDGQKLIYTKRLNGNEDFYESNRLTNGWSKAIPLKGNINSKDYNEGAQNISQDGKWLIFTGCNFPDGYGSCDLYISYLNKNGWSTPQNLGPNINSQFWESTPSLSPDKRDLYFSSNMPGGYGGNDIWVSHRNEKGIWSEPINLGPEVNTTGDESTPFIHADNQTLYFNSTGHAGYSEKADLFITKKQTDGTWSKPENLGYPINTIDEEGALIVSADGKTAFYSSDRFDSKGDLDIYQFELREDIRPTKTFWLSGKVFDKTTGIGLASTVELTDLSSKQIISKLQTDEDGNYLITLPIGKEYAFNVQRKGYLFYSENYDLIHYKDSVFKMDIPLQPLMANASIVLKNIFFGTNESKLKPESEIELEKIVRLMKDNPMLKIEIRGFTDNVGKQQDNLALSTARAVSVVNYLLLQGIQKDRLSFKGYGESNPIADNGTEEGRSQNRRTELSVKGNQ